MHQPSYVDPESDRSLMPWVRLHAIKDYYDMGRVVKDVPGARAVFNFVPSLWEQMDKLAKGEWLDEHEILSRKPVEMLSAEERDFIAQQFFSAHYPSMIEPYPQYRDLYFRFGPQGDPDLIQNAELSSIIDLQVWFHLAWCGHTLKEDPFVAHLFRKGSGFTQDEKIKLLDIQRELIASIPQFYRELSESKTVEVSTTPYYHPILPLLIDPEAAHVAWPGMPLPRERYPLPKDAEQHVKMALKAHGDLFGEAPAGFWPAEGSVSPEAARMFAENGARWIATDEEVLRLSLGKSSLSALEKYRIYEYGGVKLFFRDHQLSDRIGFVYQGHDTQEAVADFLYLLDGIREHLPPDGDFVVPVILDGENCWEFYEDQGRPFLLDLYQGLVDHENIDLTTCRQVLEEDLEAQTLPQLHSGSWIDANFSTWVGDPIKNLGWTYLYQARKHAEQALAGDKLDEKSRAELLENIFAAEGSDWFWWFGEGHSSEYDILFDKLFRKRLAAIYRCTGAEVPDHLSRPLDDRLGGKARYSLPNYMIHPTIDGKTGSYWEWLNAGSCLPQGGSMQRSTIRLQKLSYGFNDRYLLFRLETPLIVSDGNGKDKTVNIIFSSPGEFQVSVPLRTTAKAVIDEHDVIYAVKQNVEIAVPISLVQAEEIKEEIAAPIEFVATLQQAGREIERLPEDGRIRLPFPSPSFDEENWFI